MISANDFPGRLDTHSDTWAYVSAWAEAELQALRGRNDSLKLNEVQTAAVRGEIKRLLVLLALPNPPKVRVHAPPNENE